MNFHIGKIYKMPKHFYFYKSNQPNFWMEYLIKIPEKKLEKNIEYNKIISEIDNSCLEYCKNIVLLPENTDNLLDDDDSWVDIKKIL